MARRVRDHAWAETPLGPIGSWTEPLKTIVDLVLANATVASLAVGPERVLIYNDRAAPLYGGRHPDVLGRPLAAAFPGSYPEVADIYDRVFSGETAEVHDHPLSVSEAGGEIFDAYLTPVRDAAGTVIGAYMIGLETGRRARTEAALRESEAKYRMLFESLQEGFGICELVRSGEGEAVDWRFLEMNRAFASHSGLDRDRDACVGRLVSELFPGADRRRWLAVYQAVVDTRSPTAFELFWAPTGRWSAGVAAPADGDRFTVVYQDVTERKRAEATLRESEERLRQFGEASQDVLWVRDAERFQWEYLTPAFETIYGIDRETALRGDNLVGWLELIEPEDRAQAAASLRRVREGERVTFEYRLRRPADGGVRWMRDTDFPIRDGAGTVVRIGGIGHDITALKEAEARLAEAEARQRALMEGIPQLVWRGVDGGRWTWASPQWTAYTGQSEAESRGYGWLEAVHPDDREPLRVIWNGAMARGGFHAECRVRHGEEGPFRWFQSRATPVRDEAGSIVEWLGTSTEVQELRALQDRQKVLLHELQHRVRNTLAVVRSIALSTGETSASVEEFSSHLQGRLGAFARTQMVLTRAPDGGVALEALVREELLAQAAREEQIDVEGPEVLLSAKAAEVVALVIHELGTNAVKYGALSAPTGRVSVRWTTEPRGAETWLVLSWTESGVRVAAAAPRREGFGTELIETRVPYELRGRGVLEFRPGGVRCGLEFPLRTGESMLQTNAPGAQADERS